MRTVQPVTKNGLHADIHMGVADMGDNIYVTWALTDTSTKKIIYSGNIWESRNPIQIQSNIM